MREIKSWTLVKTFVHKLFSRFDLETLLQFLRQSRGAVLGRVAKT